MEEAAARGLRVPEDLSVVGFDNVPESAMTRPGLTTVHQPIQEMGERAVQILVGLLAGRAPDAMHQTLTDPPRRTALLRTSSMTTGTSARPAVRPPAPCAAPLLPTPR